MVKPAPCAPCQRRLAGKCASFPRPRAADRASAIDEDPTAADKVEAVVPAWRVLSPSAKAIGMILLTPSESRVLGVLIEKELTTPDQYPLSLNALGSGCNQKSNRDPVLAMSDDDVMEAVESLREKGLSVRVDMVGSRVHRYKHTAAQALQSGPRELALIAELLLRGPQTLGELRGRASRMHAFDSLEVVRATLEGLQTRPEPLVRQIAPAPGIRAERFVQLISPDAHPLNTMAAAAESTASTPSTDDPALADRVARLEEEVAALRELVNDARRD